MAQHDYILDNQPGASFRADLNAALAAIVTSNSGASAPSPTYPYQRWMDTTNNVERRRNAANTAWIDVATLLESFVVDRSSNTAWTRADRGRVFRVTGSYTQTADAAATLGDGWSVAVRVESGATLTIDPNGAETIDGATTKTITGPSSGRVHCNGSALYTEGFASADVLTNPYNTTQTLTYGTTTNWNMNLGHIAILTLTGNTTLATSNLKPGVYVLHVIQDGTGGRTITWPSIVKWPAGSAPPLTSTANARDVFSFVSDGTNLYGSILPDVR